MKRKAAHCTRPVVFGLVPLRAERGRGRAILFTTHDLAEALAHSDRQAVLARGKVPTRSLTRAQS